MTISVLPVQAAGPASATTGVIPGTGTIDVTPSKVQPDKPAVQKPQKPETVTPPAIENPAPSTIEERPSPSPITEMPRESGQGKKIGMSVRIKDLTHIRGVCDNQLVGYGLVSGLNGSGDRKGLCENSISVAMKNVGINISPTTDFKPKNMAAVMVTASLPAFAKSGDSIDVMVSSIGDATNLEGGVLLMTTLKGANGQVFATAQGAISIGGMNYSGMRKTDSKNYPLVGKVPAGGLICRDMHTELTRDKQIYIVLNDPDFNTAASIAGAINKKYAGAGAEAIDSQTIRINNIYNSPSEAVVFISEINNVEVMPETAARIVINERTGTIVMGADVRILPVAISHGCIDISVGSKSLEKDVKMMKNGKTFYLGTGASVKTLVEMLNYIGASPRDVISIFQALKSANALPAELIIL
jgi:flagellar P-ring protein precursor FlgI